MHMHVKVLNSRSRRYSVLNHKVFMVLRIPYPYPLKWDLHVYCGFQIATRNRGGNALSNFTR